MAGAWEIGAPEVLVAVLTREMVTFEWAWALAPFMMHLPASAGRASKSGMPYDCARNTAVEDALRGGYTWLMFLDDDVIPPPDAYRRLIAHGKDIVSGLYYRRAPPIVPVAMRYNAAGGTDWITGWETPGQLIEADLVGAGCLVIHRRVLERMTPPWFEWQIGKPPSATLPGDPRPQARLSEDFAFCRRAKREFGFGVYVDTSVVCSHEGRGKSVPGSGFVPSGV